MNLPAPTSLDELIADGALVQADVDATWSATQGTVTGVEFTGDTVRLHSRAGVRDLPAREVARIVDGEWTWSEDHDLDVPELHGPQPAGEELLRAARTLHGNVPVLLAPYPDGARAVAVDVHTAPGPVRSALTLGLAQLSPLLDARRALLSFAAARGLGVRTTEDSFGFSDGTTVTFEGDRPVDVSGGLSLREVRADALHLSGEHQLLLHGLHPDPDIRLDIPAGRARIDGHEARALIIATVTAGTWTWAWADPHLPPSPAANLRRFGLDHGIIDLVRPRLPRDTALIDVAKPVLDVWTHAVVPLTPETDAVVLLDAPHLTLPGPEDPRTRRAVEMVLGAGVPEGVDKRRAREAYAQRRGVTLPADPG